jgi:hypothetical protein
MTVGVVIDVGLLRVCIMQDDLCIEDDEAQAFWQARGFERDMVCLSLYGRS